MNATSAPLLSLTDVHKRYGSSVAVNSVSLDVADGEFISFLGPSGSGKTTTLRMVAGFTIPDAGTVTLAGNDLTVVPPHKRDIGMVFQHYALFPHMTVAQNIGFPLRMRKVPKEEITRRVGVALEQVHLTPLADRKPGQLSGGQQQRVALARSFVFEPKLLLMDEPLGALDKKLREALQVEITRITKGLGMTVVYVTHDQDEALAMSDRIAIYNNGAIEQLGTGRELYERPKSLFVATFMGDSNVFRGVFSSGGGLRSNVGQLATPSNETAIAESERACIVVRPERLRVQRSSSTDGVEIGRNAVLGTVREVVYLGAQQRVLVNVPGTAEKMVKQPAAAADFALRPGDSVCLSWAPADSVLVADTEPAVLDEEAAA